MPVKIPFTVVYCTGADDGFPATDLELHGPVVSGWRTPRLCAWPQELIVDLEHVARIRKLQILSHQYMIASKIEIAASVDSNIFKKLGHVSLSTNSESQYKARELKSVHIDTVARYLKILVHKSHVNIHNWYNQVGIVALNLIGDVDVQLMQSTRNGAHESLAGSSIPSKFPLMGSDTQDRLTISMASGRIDYLGRKEQGISKPDLSQHLGGATLGKINVLGHNAVDPHHDLTFDIFLDQEIGGIIKTLIELKRSSVLSEQYEKAQELKECIDGLLLAGEELARIDRLKQRAVDAEDYETAEMVRAQIATFREKCYAVLGVNTLIEQGYLQPVPSMTKGSRSSNFGITQSEPLPAIRPAAKEGAGDRSTTFTKARKEPSILLHEPPQSPMEAWATESIQKKSSPEPEKKIASRIFTREATVVLPRKLSTVALPEVLPEVPSVIRPLSQASSVVIQPRKQAELISMTVEKDDNAARSPSSTTNDPSKPDSITAKARAMASYAIEIFGEKTVSCVFSKSFKWKTSGLESIEQSVRSGNIDKFMKGRNHVRVSKDAISVVLAQALKDSLLQVLKATEKVLDAYLERHGQKLIEEDLTALVAGYFSGMLSKSGEASHRIKNYAERCLVKVLSNPPFINHAAGFDAILIHQPAKNWREDEGRLHIILSLIKSDVNATSFTPKHIMETVAVAIMDKHETVRAAGKTVGVALIERHGKQIEKFMHLLSPDSTSTKDLQAILMKSSRDTPEATSRTTDDPIKIERGKRRAAAKQRAVKSANDTDLLPEDDSAVPVVEGACPFCREKVENEGGGSLEEHYFDVCPMLMQCLHCQQIVETRNYNEHLSIECGRKEEFVACTDCGNQVHKVEMESHKGNNVCIKCPSSKFVCPLCQQVQSASDSRWRDHLSNHCTANPRSKAYTHGDIKKPDIKADSVQTESQVSMGDTASERSAMDRKAIRSALRAKRKAEKAMKKKVKSEAEISKTSKRRETFKVAPDQQMNSAMSLQSLPPIPSEA